MLHLKFRVSCDEIGCDESTEIEVDWSEVSLDLNDKMINLSYSQLYQKDWDRESDHDYYGNLDVRFYCPKHKRRK